MAVRTKAIFCLAVAAALTSVGCGSRQQQSRFQTAFLPPAPREAPAAVELADPPSIPQPNIYLENVPAFLIAAPGVSDQKLTADAMVQRAAQRLQRGRYYYQRRDIASSRREFDAAVDLMLEASAGNPADSPIYAHLLEGMVDEIHRLDVAGMGASAVDEGKFEKAPLEDILEMTFPVDPRLKDKVREQVAATVSQLPLSVNDAVLGYINYFTNRGHKTLIYGHGARRPVPPHDPAHPGRRGRAAGADPPGAGRIRLHPARRFAKGRRRDVAVSGVAGPGVRLDPQLLRGRAHGSGKGDAGGRPAPARPVPGIRRLVPGHCGVQLRTR